MSSAPTGDALPGDAPARWVSWHVHLPHSLHTPYLRDVVRPLLVRHGLLDHFFFLRYWQGGPHLRLRVLRGRHAGSPGAVAELVEGLRAALPSLDDAAADEYAQGVAMQARLAELEGEVPAEPRTPGVWPARYEPELRKYGGVHGVAVAEEVFRRTSVAVLDALGVAPAGRPPVGEAVGVMAAALHAAGFDVAGACAFLDRYERWWLRYAPPAYRAAWPDVQARVGPEVAALCATLWDGGGVDDPFHDAVARATAAVRARCGAGDDVAVEDLVIDGTPYPGCVSNYVHTTNNRLGLVPAGEGLVAHLVRRALEDLPVAGAASVPATAGRPV